MAEERQAGGAAVLEAEGLRKVFRDFWKRPRTVAVDGVSLRGGAGAGAPERTV